LSRETDVKNKARDLLDRVGIAHLERENPRNLSGGEARRVAIARGLITDPKLLIADEPTGDLDPKNTDEVLRLFTEFHRQGVSIIMVTHERDFPAAANRYFVMDSGKLTEQ
jgi:putative ABC transport system ATP-binding protein